MKKTATIGMVVFMGAVLIFAFTACGKKAEQPQTAEKTDSSAPAATNQQAVVLPQGGEWKDAGMFGFRADNIKILKMYDAAFSAGEGKIYVEVEYTIRNNTDAVQTYATMLSGLKLTDPNGKAYEYAPGLGNWIESQGDKDGKVQPKAEMKLSCVFEVEGDAGLMVAGWTFDVGNSDLNAPASVAFELK